MNNEDLNEVSDLHEAVKIMDSRGWAVIMAYLAQDREKIIRIVSGAQTKGEARKHDWEYFQGVLAGFQRAVDIPESLRSRYEEILELSKKEKDNEHDGQIKAHERY